MSTSTDDEWMRVEDAFAFLGMSHGEAIDAICLRAYSGLIKARAKQYIDGTGRRFGNKELPPEFWWSAREIDGNWRTGDLATTSPGSPARLQALGVTFRRLDIEQMISLAPRGANGAPLSSTETGTGSKVIAPTDGDDWITAREATELLPHSTRAICAHAREGLIGARAKLLIWGGKRHSKVDVPREFWWADGEEALEQDWRTGRFVTWIRNGTVRLEAFMVEFRRADIEQLKPASAAKAAPSRAARLRVSSNKQAPLNPSRHATLSSVTAGGRRNGSNSKSFCAIAFTCPLSNSTALRLPVSLPPRV